MYFVAAVGKLVHNDLGAPDVDESATCKRRHDHINKVTSICTQHANNDADWGCTGKDGDELSYECEVVREILDEGNTEGGASCTLVDNNSDDHLHGRSPIRLKTSGDSFEGCVDTKRDHQHKWSKVALLLLRLFKLIVHLPLLDIHWVVIHRHWADFRVVDFGRRDFILIVQKRGVGTSFLVWFLSGLHPRGKLVVGVVVVVNSNLCIGIGSISQRFFEIVFELNLGGILFFEQIRSIEQDFINDENERVAGPHQEVGKWE